MSTLTGAGLMLDKMPERPKDRRDRSKLEKAGLEGQIKAEQSDQREAEVTPKERINLCQTIKYRNKHNYPQTTLN